MPGFNRKGPNAEGPMTGRGLGRCRPKYRQEVFDTDDAPALTADENNNSHEERSFLFGGAMGRQHGFGAGRWNRCHLHRGARQLGMRGSKNGRGMGRGRW